MAQQPTPRKSSTKQAVVARRLNATSMKPAQHVLDATVEFISDPRDIIERVGRYGTVWFVRSSKFHNLYYVVIWNAARAVYQCSCGAECRTHRHTVAVSQQNKAVA